jgi:hypothetical protein
MFRVVHEIDDHVAVYHGDAHLFTYVYNSRLPAFEAPRPYFHPIRTLAGDVVTGFRPHDHRWHHGLSLAFAHINGHNFWGGVTYIHGQGYVLLDNIGMQEDSPHNPDDSVSIVIRDDHISSRLEWHTRTYDVLLLEQRFVTLRAIHADEGWYRISIVTELTNQTGDVLEFGSPTTQGRPKAGYGGLFWRGARDMTGGKILMSDGREAVGDESTLMGERSPWMAYTSPHDGADRDSTVIFVDKPKNPRYPTQWFVRASNFAAISASFMFDKVYILQPKESLRLGYDMIIANGALSGERIQELVDSV